MKFRLIGMGAVLLAASVLQIIEPSPLAAYPTANVQLVGHGYGHGRGLSQYGSYGYAKDYGWSYTQILDHYYGGTDMATIDDNVPITVRLMAADAQDLIVRSDAGFTVGGRSFAAQSAARIRLTGSNQWTIDESSSTGSNACAGGNSGWVNGVATVNSSYVVAKGAQGDQGTSPDITKMIAVCAGGNTITYRGEINAMNDNGTQRAVNSVRLKDYLLGVVPRESPASWGSSGGQEALKAQAVAARSYAMASSNYDYARTCDTTACQVYMGVSKNGEFLEPTNTTNAVLDTAGQVREFVNTSTIARTEFSSSSGGWTAGGTFPAVEDVGDSVSANSRHSWSSSVPVSTIESAYSSIGTLQSISLDTRNGLGEWGGRVSSMRLIGTSGTVTIPGNTFRSVINTAAGTTLLWSDWFNIQYQPSGGVGGYWLMGSDGGIFSYGNAAFYGSMGGKPLNKPVVGLSPTADTRGYWLVASDGGVFSFGNAGFFGSMGGQPLNQPVVAMMPTPSGNGYWQVASDGGIFAFGDAGFYGSMGGQKLNKPVVAMAATPSGNGYWLVASDGGIFAFGDAEFKGSMGGTALSRSVVGMAAAADGSGYWMIAADGGIFAFNVPFFGSLPGSSVTATATGISPTATSNGYLISTSSGSVYPYGDAPYFGDRFGQSFVGTITGVARSFE